MVMGPKLAESLTKNAGEWITSQSFNNVLLLLIFGAISWFGYYSITTAIPGHLQQIQDGYQSINDAHLIERESMRESSKQTRDMYDKWMSDVVTRINASRTSAPLPSIPASSGRE